MTSEEWYKRVGMGYIDIVLIIADLASSEASDAIHLEALAESEAAGQKAEQEREHFWEMHEGMRERAEQAEKSRDMWHDTSKMFLLRAQKAEEELAACRLDRDKLEEYWEKRQDEK